MSEFADSKRAALERQGWHCLRCGTNIHDPSCWPGRSGHHRQLRRAADPDVRHSPANIVELCGSGTTGCHGWVHQHVAEAERLGLIVPLGIDPLSTPVRDWQGRWLWLNQDGTATPLTMRETLTIQTISIHALRKESDRAAGHFCPLSETQASCLALSISNNTTGATNNMPKTSSCLSVSF